MRKWIYSLLILALTIIFLGRFCIQEMRSVIKMPAVANVTGRLQGYPEFKLHHTSFTLQTKRLGKIKLNWYGKRPLLYPGQVLRLKVKLHQANSKSGYGLFLQRRGFSGYGYVKFSLDSGLRGNDTESDSHMIEDLENFRQNLHFKLLHLLNSIHCPEDLKGKILALAIGDRSLLSKKDWQVLQATGTSHLVAISGLHIGLIAFFVYWLVRFLWSRSIFLTHQFCGARLPALVSGFIVACMYALVSGFGLPAERTVLMLGTVLVYELRRKSSPVFKIWVFAFIASLALHPWALYSMSFWMSFLAVFCLIYLLSSRVGVGARVKNILYFQLAITVLLLPVGLFNFGIFSTVSFFVNLWAIPWVSFFLVPAVFLMLIFVWFQPLAICFAVISKYAAMVWWGGLKWFAHVPFSSIHLHLPGICALVLCQIGVFLLFMPKAFPIRYSGLLLVLPVLLWSTN